MVDILPLPSEYRTSFKIPFEERTSFLDSCNGNVILVLSCHPDNMATFFPVYSFSTVFALYYIITFPAPNAGLDMQNVWPTPFRGFTRKWSNDWLDHLKIRLNSPVFIYHWKTPWLDDIGPLEYQTSPVFRRPLYWDSSSH